MKILDLESECVLKDCFVWLPLLYCAEVYEACAGTGAAKNQVIAKNQANTIINVRGELYIKSASLDSLVDCFSTIRPEEYEKFKNDCLKKMGLDFEKIEIDKRIEITIFEVMPRLIKMHKGLDRKKINDGQTIEFLNQHLSIPAEYFKKAENYLNIEQARKKLDALDKEQLNYGISKPADEVLKPEQLNELLTEALENRILLQEKERLRKILSEENKDLKKSITRAAIILYIQDKGFEIQGFGIMRADSTHIAYKRTGKYVLKDFDGQLYLFPDCRVGVMLSNEVSKPIVIDKYKHPFLEGFNKMQKICITDYNLRQEPQAKNIINALSKGINTLFCGYNTVKGGFEGYNKLSTKNDNGFRPYEEYKIKSSHPLIASGELIITNEFAMK